MDRPNPATSTNDADAEECVHDARHARQVDDSEVDDPRQPGLTSVFVEINAREHTDGRGNRERQEHDVERPDERGPEASCGHVVLRILDEQGP